MALHLGRNRSSDTDRDEFGVFDGQTEIGIVYRHSGEWQWLLHVPFTPGQSADEALNSLLRAYELFRQAAWPIAEEADADVIIAAEV